ncbi:MAG TPA: FumA C-terminus/TtdB family hydratase beta subunit [Fervidobacterium sp.]|nr:FumA C-terminus/TtdB family hydratase beta subunit [Fervidobacterium sp.]HQE48262.1 FumA C-terminus/TtdB family hydratase beta subunit [Fervidobacterium sp.]HUM42027.1 FumA C-terminus/TtdB family hydratase beta subunit [Fervidobacterium sp.]
MQEDLTNTFRQARVGEKIEYTGSMLVMRDIAQKRLVEIDKSGMMLPLDLKDQVIFYAGPTFVKGHMVIGPTTSKRMDRFLEFIISKGVIATIGKGKRTQEAELLCAKHKVPYLVTPSGCAAYLASCVTRWEIVAFEELGPEAIYRIEVVNFPLLVAVDAFGRSVF